MALKALDKDELIHVLNELGYKELATATKRWDLGNVVEESTSLFRMGLDTKISNVKLSFVKAHEYEDISREGGSAGVSAAGYAKACEILNKIIDDLVRGTKEYQEEIFATEHNIYNSHSMLELPLDKKPGLNALYDDFAAVYLFFDDISAIPNNIGTVLKSITDTALIDHILKTLDVSSLDRARIRALATPEERALYWKDKHGKDMIDIFEAIEDVDERIKFVKEHVKFDHLNLGGVRNPNWAIFIYGKSEPTVSKMGSDNQQAITADSGFYDFNNVRLIDTLKIKNRDLMQILQSRIDMDKEDLELLDEQVIGGDEYKLVKIRPEMMNGRTDINPLLVRFVCPSTGRVYHVECDKSALIDSKYFDANDYKTYLESWWHISHGGMDPRTCTNVIRT